MGTISKWTSGENQLKNYLKKNKRIILQLNHDKNKAKMLGEAAELIASDHLEGCGLKLIARNFRCRLGEIDLIMQDNDELVFVEVRYRQNNNFGGAINSIDKRKCQKMIKTAFFYLHQERYYDEKPCRFDVMIIHSMHCKRVEWIKDAFRLDD